MLNSEKMLTAIQNQDLEQAQKYFEQALTEDDDQTLLALADYLQSIGFYPPVSYTHLDVYKRQGLRSSLVLGKIMISSRN